MKNSKPKYRVMIADFRFIGSVIVCFVGNDIQELRRKFYSLLKRRKATMTRQRMQSIFDEVVSMRREAGDHFDGMCLWPTSDRSTPYIWMDEWHLQILVHEIVHAVSGLMRIKGLEDGRDSEVRAYMTDYAFRIFSNETGK